MTPNNEALAVARDCLESIKAHCEPQPSALARSVVATCERGLAALASSGQAASAVPAVAAEKALHAKIVAVIDATPPERDYDSHWIATRIVEAIASPTQPASAQAREGVTLRERLQQRCSDWGVYWRASDAHGVDLSHEQALDLLRDALGVEVEIATPAAREAEPCGLTECQGRPRCARCLHWDKLDAGVKHSAQLREVLERLTLWARTQVGRCECTGDHPIADAERALGWRK